MDSSEIITKDEGLRLLKAGQIEEAIGVLLKVAEKNSDDAQVQSYLGVAYNQKGDRMRAIHAFEESLRLEETPKAYFNLGVVYESSNRLEEAVRQYEMALSLDENYAQAQQALSKLHEQFEAQQQMLTQTQAIPAAAGAAPEPTIIGGVPPMVGGAPSHHVQQAPQSKNAPPDPLLWQIEEQKKIIEQQRAMTKAGLIYGIICGAIIVPLLFFARVVFLPFGLMIPHFATQGNGLFAFVGMLIVFGAMFGAGVGYWVGRTCEGESAGRKAGALMGFVLGIVVGAIAGDLLIAIINGLFSALLGAITGHIIGKMVDASIR